MLLIEIAYGLHQLHDLILTRHGTKGDAFDYSGKVAFHKIVVDIVDHLLYSSFPRHHIRNFLSDLPNNIGVSLIGTLLELGDLVVVDKVSQFRSEIHKIILSRQAGTEMEGVLFGEIAGEAVHSLPQVFFPFYDTVMVTDQVLYQYLTTLPRFLFRTGQQFDRAVLLLAEFFCPADILPQFLQRTV